MTDKPLLEKWDERAEEFLQIGDRYKQEQARAIGRNIDELKDKVRELKEWVSSQPKRELYHSRIKSKIDEVFGKEEVSK